MIQKQTKARGFTIVELLIVIVVIAILAAITIVAYNGIQTRARTSAAQAASNTLIKKAEAANAVVGSYPQVAAGFSNQLDSSLTGSGLTLVAVAGLGSTVSPSTVSYVPCTGTAGTGAVISYWNYQTGAAVPTTIGQPTGATCVAAAAVTGTY